MSHRKLDRGIPRIEIGTKDMPGHPAQALKGQHPLGRHLAGLAPLRDGALVDPEFARDGALATGGFYRFLNMIFPHDPKYITEIDIPSNAKSDSGHWHAPYMNVPPTKTTFWDRLVEAAKANGIEPTQEAIAASLGIRQSAVAKWKKSGRPKTTRLEEISRKWRYNLNWLQTEEGPKRPAGTGEVDEIAEVLTLFKSLNSNNRKAALGLIREIRKGQLQASREREPV